DRGRRHRRDPGHGRARPLHRTAVPVADGARPGRDQPAVRAAAGGARLMARRLERGSRLVIATHNPGKLREMQELLAPHAIEAVSAGELGLPEPEEDAPDFAGNARIKAVAAASAGMPALADDSGFCV